MNRATRQYEERLAEEALELLRIAEQFVALYGAGGPETAFDRLYRRAKHAIEKVIGDSEE